jgi:hypothetical protein
MNLFLIAWRPAGGLDAREPDRHLKALLPDLPPPQPSVATRWNAPSGRLAMACAAHDPALVGSVRYVHAEPERFAMFAGRPFRWSADERADGREPLAARTYLDRAGAWLEGLDGRYVAIRYDDSTGLLELAPDALGAYPLYRGRAGGTEWISNNALLVRDAVGGGEPSLSAIAAMLSGGRSFTGQSGWQGVERVPRGFRCELRASGADTETQQLPVQRLAALAGGGYDAARTARLLRAATAALADWPGRPVLLQLSGGRDSRLLLAAGAGAQGRPLTVGDPDAPDVRVARELCDQLDLEHERLPEELHSVGLDDRARFLALTSAGVISLADARGYFAAPDGALPLWINGGAGELARGYYGSAEGLDRDGLVARLRQKLTSHSSWLLTNAGTELIERDLAGIVDRLLGDGAVPCDVLDIFYADSVVPGWAGPGHGCVEYAKGDTVCPLWSWRLLPDELGLPAPERAGGDFVDRTLTALEPSLARIPYAHAASRPPASDEFAAVCRRVREALADPGLPASIWEALDRGAAERLLATDPAALTGRERRAVLHLGTVALMRASR